MNDDLPLDPLQRLDLIERMIADSRRGFDSYAWNFVLWGCGHTVALLWQWYLPQPRWSWPASMLACALIAGVVASRRRRRPASELGRSLGAIWMAFISAVIVIFSCDRHQPLESFFVVYGMAYIASGLALRYALQVAMGVAWLGVAAVVLLTGSGALEHWGFLLMALVGEIGFGVLGMRRDAAMDQPQVARG